MGRGFNISEKKFAQAVDRELTKLAVQDKDKPERIKFLERMFVMAGDKAAKVNERIRGGFLNEEDIIPDFLEKQITRTRAYLDALTSLHLEYSKTTSRINPDYAKFLKYVSDNLDNLELEKAFRKVYGARKK